MVLLDVLPPNWITPNVERLVQVLRGYARYNQHAEPARHHAEPACHHLQQCMCAIPGGAERGSPTILECRLISKLGCSTNTNDGGFGTSCRGLTVDVSSSLSQPLGCGGIELGKSVYGGCHVSASWTGVHACLAFLWPRGSPAGTQSVCHLQQCGLRWTLEQTASRRRSTWDGKGITGVDGAWKQGCIHCGDCCTAATSRRRELSVSHLQQYLLK